MAEDYIKIEKGNKSGGYFIIGPDKYGPKSQSNTDDYDDWEKYKDYVISIDELDITDYLLYFLLKHFNVDLEANQTRELATYEKNTFVYYLERNYFSYSEVEQIINDIKILLKIIDSASSKKDLIAKTKKQFPPLERFGYRLCDVSKDITNDFNHSVNAIADFYRRFIDEMTNIMKNCPECNVITFVGP